MVNVAKIRVFAAEQTGINASSPEGCGVARVGGTKPTVGGGRRLAPIPCQFIVRGYDSSNVEIPDIRDGKLLSNGNTVIFAWQAALVNQRTNPAYVWGNKRNAADVISETATPGSPASVLGYSIDKSGLLVPGLDGYVPGDAQHNYYYDRTCDGFITVNYKEKKAGGTFTNQLTDQAKAVIGPPDWSTNWVCHDGECWTWPS